MGLLINAYCRQNRIEQKPKGETKPIKIVPKSERIKRHIIIGEAYQSGRTVQEIMDQFNIKLTTTLDHLFKYLLEGNPIRSDDILSLSSLPSSRITRCLEAFEKYGPERLKPVFDAFNSEISYDDLKILRLYHLSRLKNTNEYDSL